MDIAITGIGLTSGLGDGAEDHEKKISSAQNSLRPLGDLLGKGSPFSSLKASWISDRSLMLSRKWAPASALSLHVARQAIADAALGSVDLTNAAVIVGSSRGNAAGWTSPWQGRRPFDILAASNTMHGELASAVSIELGIKGPWQVISSGCAASLDALGMAWMMLRQGIVERALVIGVELPLVPEILDTYKKTGVLAASEINDPYSEKTAGFFPGEGAAALVLERQNSFEKRRGQKESDKSIMMSGYWCNSDAHSPLGMPVDGAGLSACLQKVIEDLQDQAPITAVCPHASGTPLHGAAELSALSRTLPKERAISLHPLKPFTGHTIGASGALETAILIHYLRQERLPANMPYKETQEFPFTFFPSEFSQDPFSVLKISVGMGGHNSVLSLSVK